MAWRGSETSLNRRAPRFFGIGPIVEGAFIRLAEEELKHIRVRRLVDGDRVEVLDGDGDLGVGHLRKNGSEVEVDSVRMSVGEPPVSWGIALAWAEPTRIEWAIEKGTECGANRFVIFTAARSQHAPGPGMAKRLDRLQKVAREAVKQCGRSVVPRVEGPLSWDDLLLLRPAMVAIPGAPPLRSGGLVNSLLGGVVVIGPEGGLTDTEQEDLVSRGAVPFGLGDRILRLETAVVVTLSRLNQPLG